MAVDPQVLPQRPLHRAQDLISLHLVGGEVVGRAAPPLPPQRPEVTGVESDSATGERGRDGYEGVEETEAHSHSRSRVEVVGAGEGDHVPRRDRDVVKNLYGNAEPVFRNYHGTLSFLKFLYQMIGPYLGLG